VHGAQHRQGSLDCAELAESLCGRKSKGCELLVELVACSALRALLSLKLLQAREGDGHDLEEDRSVNRWDDAKGENTDIRDGASSDAVDVAQQAIRGHRLRESRNVHSGQAVVDADAGCSDEADQQCNFLQEFEGQARAGASLVTGDCRDGGCLLWPR
jgi:hypothetical protein